MLTKIIDGSRVDGENGDLLGDGGGFSEFAFMQVVVSSSNDSLGLPPAVSNSDASPLLVDTTAMSILGMSSRSEELEPLSKIPVASGSKDVVEGRGVPKVQIMDLVIASPTHDLTR